MKNIDSKIYGDILAKFQPRAIKTEEENEKYLAEVEKLMELGDNITSEQEELLKLLVALIEQFEDQHYQLKQATPYEIINELMLERGLKPKDMLDFLGSKEITSEVINGKSSISKAQAKALGEFFHVSPALFL